MTNFEHCQLYINAIRSNLDNQRYVHPRYPAFIVIEKHSEIFKMNKLTKDVEDIRPSEGLAKKTTSNEDKEGPKHCP